MYRVYDHHQMAFLVGSDNYYSKIIQNIDREYDIATHPHIRSCIALHNHPSPSLTTLGEWHHNHHHIRHSHHHHYYYYHHKLRQHKVVGAYSKSEIVYRWGIWDNTHLLIGLHMVHNQWLNEEKIAPIAMYRHCKIVCNEYPVISTRVAHFLR